MLGMNRGLSKRLNNPFVISSAAWLAGIISRANIHQAIEPTIHANAPMSTAISKHRPGSIKRVRKARRQVLTAKEVNVGFVSHAAPEFLHARAHQVVADMECSWIAVTAVARLLRAFKNGVRHLLFGLLDSLCNPVQLQAVSIASGQVHALIHAGRVFPQGGFSPGSCFDERFPGNSLQRPQGANAPNYQPFAFQIRAQPLDDGELQHRSEGPQLLDVQRLRLS